MSRQLAYRSNFGLALATGVSPATRPDPNTLGIPDPYGTPSPADFDDVSAAWTGQGIKAIFPRLTEQQIESHPPHIWFMLDPSDPGATVDLAIWFWHKESGRWIQPATGGAASYGPDSLADFIDEVLLAPMYLEVTAISSGTVDIYVDEFTSEVL